MYNTEQRKAGGSPVSGGLQGSGLQSPLTSSFYASIASAQRTARQRVHRMVAGIRAGVLTLPFRTLLSLLPPLQPGGPAPLVCSQNAVICSLPGACSSSGALLSTLLP